MAPRLTPLRLWGGGIAAACALVLVAMTPHGTPARRSRTATTSPVTPIRAAANALAFEWRDADRRARLASYRTALAPTIAELRRTETPRAALWFDGPIDPADRATLAAQLDTVWRALQLGVPKVALGVVIVAPAASAVPDAHHRQPARQESSSPVFLFPDSTDRGACVVLIPLDRWNRRRAGGERLRPGPALDAWLRSGLGVCAFYAAMGSPSTHVAHWLAVRQYDLALSIGWDRPPPPAGRQNGWFGPDAERSPWFRRILYAMPPDAVACLGGRVEGCRSAVLAGAEGAAPVTGDFDATRWWRRQRLFGGEWYLSDLIRGFGRPRVAEFWNADLPVDSAFVTAFGTDIGAWTRRWQREQLATVALGPRPPLPAAAGGLGGIVLALLATARVVSRRRVA